MESKQIKKLHHDDDPSSSEYLSSTSAPWLTKHIASLLSLSTVVLSFTFFFILIYYPLEPEKKRYCNLHLGRTFCY